MSRNLFKRCGFPSGQPSHGKWHFGYWNFLWSLEYCWNNHVEMLRSSKKWIRLATSKLSHEGSCKTWQSSKVQTILYFTTEDWEKLLQECFAVYSVCFKSLAISRHQRVWHNYFSTCQGDWYGCHWICSQLGRPAWRSITCSNLGWRWWLAWLSLRDFDIFQSWWWCQRTRDRCIWGFCKSGLKLYFSPTSNSEILIERKERNQTWLQSFNCSFLHVMPWCKTGSRRLCAALFRKRHLSNYRFYWVRRKDDCNTFSMGMVWGNWQSCLTKNIKITAAAWTWLRIEYRPNLPGRPRLTRQIGEFLA